MRRPIDPGRLRTRLLLEEPADQPDGQGGSIPGWQPVEALWAALEPLDARREEVAAAMRQAAAYRVTLRYNDAVRAGMRFLWDDRKLLIRTVTDADETGRYLTCTCEELQSVEVEP